MPSKKPTSPDAIKTNWARLADMPFPVQEIYPAPFWSRQLSDPNQSLKKLALQRYNIIVNAGGITGSSDRGFEATNEVTFYDPISDQWQFGPSLPEPVHHLHLVAHNGYLFGLGGFAVVETKRDRRRNIPARRDGWVMRQRVYQLADINGQWQEISSMPNPQAEASCVSLNGFIHVAGGRSPKGSSNRRWTDHLDTDIHWAFDTRNNSWHQRANMIVARNSSAGVAIGGVLYVFGGRTVRGSNSAVTEAYDPLSDRWQLMAPMPEAQGGLAAAAKGNTVFVFGGEYFDNGGGVYSKIWAYDTDENRWRSAGTMPRPRHGLGAVSLNDAIYTIGGASQPSGVGTSPVLDRIIPYIR